MTFPAAPGPFALVYPKLIAESSEFIRTHRLAYKGGNRFPVLERDPARPDLLTAVLSPRVA
jgi:hypothetical protein